jgi:hypothetical protein
MNSSLLERAHFYIFCPSYLGWTRYYDSKVVIASMFSRRQPIKILISVQLWVSVYSYLPAFSTDI